MIRVFEDYDVYVGSELRWTHANVATDNQFNTVTVRSWDPNDPSNCPKVFILHDAVLLSENSQGYTWNGTVDGDPTRLSARGNARPCCGQR